MDVFGEVYERYHRDVYRCALFLTGDRARGNSSSGAPSKRRDN